VRLEVGSADLGSEWAETAGAGESGSDDVEGGRGSAGALWEGGGSRRRRRPAGDEPLNRRVVGGILGRLSWAFFSFAFFFLFLFFFFLI
jgi:hypothetical protein